MTPYYQDDSCVIYHGDCREIEAWDIACGVMVTDPPYGMGYVTHSRHESTVLPSKFDGQRVAGDESTAVRDWVLGRWTPRPALVFGTWKAQRPQGVREVIVWDKGDMGGKGALDIPWYGCHEEVYVIGCGFVGKRSAAMLRYNRKSGNFTPDHLRFHPTEKPLELMRALVSKCAPLAEIVDPFMGSGTTLRAAKDLSRKAIGIEIEERYCETAAKRLAQEVLAFDGPVVTEAENARIRLLSHEQTTTWDRQRSEAEDDWRTYGGQA